MGKSYTERSFAKALSRQALEELCVLLHRTPRQQFVAERDPLFDLFTHLRVYFHNGEENGEAKLAPLHRVSDVLACGLWNTLAQCAGGQADPEIAYDLDTVQCTVILYIETEPIKSTTSYRQHCNPSIWVRPTPYLLLILIGLLLAVGVWWYPVPVMKAVGFKCPYDMTFQEKVYSIWWRLDEDVKLNYPRWKEMLNFNHTSTCDSVARLKKQFLKSNHPDKNDTAEAEKSTAFVNAMDDSLRISFRLFNESPRWKKITQLLCETSAHSD